VFTAGADHTIAEWDATTGKLKSAARLKLPERAHPERRKAGSTPGWRTADATVLSPDGKRVAVSANSSPIHELLVYDRATGTELFGLKTGHIPPGWYAGPVFAPDGTKLFYPPAGLTTRQTKEYTSAVWEIDSGRPVCDIPLMNWESFPRGFAFSPDGTRLVRLGVLRDANGANTTLVVNCWNSSNGAKVAELVISTHPTVLGNACWLAVGADGKTAVVAVSGSDVQQRRLFTWDYTTGKVLKEVSLADGFAPTGAVAVNPDGKTFVVVGDLRAKYGERALMRLYDTTTGEVRGELLGSARWVTALAFSPDGKTLASGSSDTTVLLWDVSKLK
jgi:WD40 repeat protein